MPSGSSHPLFTSHNDVDKHTNRVAWEEGWERDLERNYSPDVLASRNPADLYPSSFIAGWDSINSGMTLETIRRVIPTFREAIVKNLVSATGQDNFEGRWRELNPDKRRDVVLEGVFQTCAEPFMEYYRGLCPDSTVKHLSSNGGETYLAMLKLFLPNNPDDNIADAVHIPHAGFDRLWDPDRFERNDKEPIVRLAITMKYSRALFMTKVLYNIFAAFVSDRIRLLNTN